MSPLTLQLYAVFHLNLAYSSIEEQHRIDVVQRCYWPLLKILENLDIPLGIEMSGHTLETIQTIDSSWIAQLKALMLNNKCELVGSGYTQIIGPLVPAEVNYWNQKIGKDTYKKILGVEPEIAFINEMAYSAGIVEHYLNNGYKAIITEWNNPRKYHPEWKNEWRYYPQKAVGTDRREIPVIWMDSIAFQKLQRFAHGESELDEYMGYIEQHINEEKRFFSFYGNDVEIFDYRPGRYKTETKIDQHGEWKKITDLLLHLKNDPRFLFVKPSDVLSGLNYTFGGNSIHLESPEQPIPVKKQEKYNINRWALTGRDDLSINTKCYRIYHSIKSSSTTMEDDWKELCYLWSSDFRTHITEKRWNNYLKRLNQFQKKWELKKDTSALKRKTLTVKAKDSTKNFSIHENDRSLTVETASIKCIFNKLKGLAIDRFWFKDVSLSPLFGTLPHGYYDDISLGADFYSGHALIEKPGKHKITDLMAYKHKIAFLSKTVLSIGFKTCIKNITIKKEYRVDSQNPSLVIISIIKVPVREIATIHPMHITLIPTLFDRGSLFYSTHNGGKDMEVFKIGNTTIHHSQSLSSLISAKHGLGVTEGVFVIGDKDKQILIWHNQAKSALIPSVHYLPINDNQYFLRVQYSAQEIDETFVKNNKEQKIEFYWRITSCKAE